MTKLTAPTGLVTATFINMCGSGAYLATLTIFLTAARHERASTAALVILCGGFGGRCAALPLGRFVERVGGRLTYLATKTIGAATMALLVVSRTAVTLSVALFCYSLASAVGGAGRNLMIREVSDREVTAFRATLRSVASAGIVVGSLMAGAVLAKGQAASVWGMVANGVSCLACAFCIMISARARKHAGSDQPDHDSGSRDGPVGRSSDRAVSQNDQGERRKVMLALFLAAAAVVSLGTPLLTYAIPLWLTVFQRPSQSWAIGPLFAVNAIVVVLLQRPTTRVVRRRNPAGVVAASGAILGGAMAAMAASWTPDPRTTLAWVVLAVLLASLSEVVFSAGWTEFLFTTRQSSRLAQASLHLTVAVAIGESFGPVLLNSTCLRSIPDGWLMAAVLVLLAACSYGVLARREGRTQ